MPFTNPCTVIEVTGRGPFPYDMLRYDPCCQANNDAVIAMEHGSHLSQRLLSKGSAH